MKQRTFFFWYSASEMFCVTFVRWQRKLNPRPHRWSTHFRRWGHGKREPGWWGIGAVVRSQWAWDHPDGWRMSRSDRLPRRHAWLAPHTELYLTKKGCRFRRGRTLKRPTMKEYERLLRRRS